MIALSKIEIKSKILKNNKKKKMMLSIKYSVNFIKWQISIIHIRKLKVHLY